MIDYTDNQTQDMFGGATSGANMAMESELQDLQSLVEDVVRRSMSSPEMHQRSKEIFTAALTQLAQMDF